MIHLNQLKKLQNQLKTEDFKTDKRTVDSNANGDNIVSTNINGNSTNKVSKEYQSCDSSRASIQNQPKQKQSSIRLSNNRHNATAWKDDTPKQTNKVIILGDSIVKHVRGYGLSHSLENCKVHVKNFPSARVKCMQDYVKPSLRENPRHLIIHVGPNDISTSKQPQQIAKPIVELALSVKSNSCDVTLSKITVRNDGHQRKVVETNRHLKALYKEKNIF